MANRDFINLLSSDSDDNENFGGVLIKDPFFGGPGLTATANNVPHHIGDHVVETGGGGWSNEPHVGASSVPLPRGDLSVAKPRPGFSLSPNEFDKEASTADILYNFFGNSGEERQLTELAPLHVGVPGFDADDSGDVSLITNDDDKRGTEECANNDGDTAPAEVTCPHCPPNLQQKRFKGARGLTAHCRLKHQDLELKSTVNQAGWDGNNLQQSEIVPVSGEQAVEVEVEGGHITGTSLQTRNGKRQQSTTGNSSPADPPPMKRSRGGEKKPKKGDRNLEDYDEDDPEYKTTKDAIKAKQGREKKKEKMKRLEGENSRLITQNQTLRQENLDLREELKSERMANQSSNGEIRVTNNIDPSSGISVNCVTLNSEQLPGATGNEQTVTVALKFGIPSVK